VAGVVARPVLEALGGRCLVLFIDQLEELLTLCNDSRQQAAFSGLLSALEGAGNIRVLATMRLDHQNQFATSQSCRALYSLLASHGGVKTLEPLSFDEIRSAILKPAEAVGLRFVPPEIVDKLAQQTANLVGGLPLLQFALWRLWEARPKRNESPLDLINDQQLAELPSVLSALGTAAESLYKQLPAPMAAACERMMLELTIPAENYQEPLRRRRREFEVVDLLVRHTQVEERQAEELIDALAKARLVVRTGEGEDAQLEVAHEAVFRNWERFRTWVSGDETKARLQALRQIGREAAQWADNNRSVDYLKQKGGPLQRALAYLRDGWLDKASREYVEHCEREEDHRIRQIEKARRTQRIMQKLSGAVVLLLLVAFFGWLGWRFWFGPEIKVAWLKSLPSEEKGRRAETVLNTVAADLLDIGEIERLVKILEGAGNIQYEVSDWVERERTITIMAPGKSTGTSPITLEHNQAHGAHAYQIRYYWSRYANKWFQDWGFPIPEILNLEEANDANAPDTLSIRAAAAKPARVSIASTETRRRLSTLPTPRASSDPTLTEDRICDPCDLDVPSTKDKVVISAAQLPDSLGAFFDEHKRQWTRLDTAMEGDSRWLVPRWTLPLWHASNVEVWPGEAAFVLAIGKTLRDRPELAVSADTVKYLLQREAISYPKTVTEARNLPDGDERIRSGLVESLKAGQVNDQFHDLLDTITDNPNKSAADIVKQGPDAPVTVDNLTGPSKPLGEEKTAAGVFAQEDTEFQPGSDRGLEEIFGKSADSLPIAVPPVQMYLGPALVDSFVRNGQLSDETLETLAEIRGELYKRFGITVPAVRFKPAEPVSSEKAFWIEILREVSAENTAGASEPQHALNKIKDRLTATRAKWLSAEATAQLVNELPAAVYEWLYERYSLTDLKRILRAVVSPIRLEPKGSPQAPEQPLSYARWLLRSLLFLDELL
jgi:hypothetical protein